MEIPSHFSAMWNKKLTVDIGVVTEFNVWLLCKFFSQIRREIKKIGNKIIWLM